jgi:hemerythrin
VIPVQVHCAQSGVIADADASQSWQIRREAPFALSFCRNPEEGEKERHGETAMVALKWLKSFEIGLKEIDDDHRQMLKIMRKIKTAGKARDFDICLVLLDQLVEFAQAHFEREEKLLHDIKYPAVAGHEAYHADLLERADVIREACKAIRSDRDLRKCCEQMFGYLIDDVIAGDMKIKSFLDATGLTDKG